MDHQNLEVIRTNIKGTAVMNRLMMALGYDAGDQNGRLEATRYAATVLAEIEKTANDDKRDLTVCTWQSVSQCMIDAARMKLFIDGRQHAHLVRQSNKGIMEAELRIGFRGYLAKISEHYENVDFTVEAIYKGDTLDINDVDGFQSYSLKVANPFNDAESDFQGVMVAMSYSKGNHRFQKVTTVSAKEIGKIRKKAKFDGVWSEWFTEKAKAAAIKRASKVHFASIQGLQALIDYDNSKNFDLDEKPAITAGSIVDNLNKALENEITPAQQAETASPAALTDGRGELLQETIPEAVAEPERVSVSDDDLFPGDRPSRLV